MPGRSLAIAAAFAATLTVSAWAAPEGGPATLRDRWSAQDLAAIAAMRLKEAGARPPEPSNAYELQPAAAALGRALFNDTRLSGNGQVACASCHAEGQQFQDGRPVGQGVGTGKRRTMPVMGAAHAPFLFWDGRKDSLWSQALGPLEDAAEHGTNRVRLATLVQVHHRDGYRAVFGELPEFGRLPRDASPGGSAQERAAWAALPQASREAVNRVFANIGKAIAAYERQLAYGESRFDRYAQAASQDPCWRLLHLDSSHLPYITSPHELAPMLLEHAAS